MNTGNTRVDDIISNNLGIEIEREIGRGKYGIVYSGYDKITKRNYAVKVISMPNREMEDKLRDLYGDNEVIIENIVYEMIFKFENEIESMKRVGAQTDHVIKLKNHILTNDGIYFDLIIIMELAKPLKRFLQQENFTVENVIDIGYQTAQCLKICHREGIIHRDVKEDNIFIGANNKIKLGDFGVANIENGNIGKMTEGVGTPHYMAPEIKTNERYDNRVDIYSLGIALYMILNDNKPPFFAPGITERDAYNMRMEGREIYPPKNAPTVLSNIILKCCKYNPEERYSDIIDVIKDLEDAKSYLRRDELDMVVPYPKRSFSDDEWWNNHFNETAAGESTNGRVGNVFRDTVSYFMDMIQRIGSGSADGNFVRQVQMDKIAAERDYNEEERKIRFLTKLLIASGCILVILIAAFCILYPKTATFYTNPNDGHRVYVKYLFFPERRLTDIAASYLISDGQNIYFSNPDEDHALYRANMWTGKAKMLDDGDCEYDVIIGNYIYFTDYDDGEKLYRIKKDGTDKQCLIEYACRDLKNKKGNLSFVLVDTGVEKELDVSTIN